MESTIETKQEQYSKWVDDVVAYLESVAPNIGEGGRACSVMQSRAVLDKDIDVLFLGCNANEDWGYCGVDRERFWTGNKYFYNSEKWKNNDAMLHEPWRVWYRLYYSLKWLGDTTPMDDGNYVFMNAIYFGTKKLNQMNQLPLFKEVRTKCLEYTEKVIQGIFKPKLIICFSVPDCFDVLCSYYGFQDVNTITPNHPNPEYECKKIVKSGFWKGIQIIGIPHPSQRISNDDLGSVANFVLEKYHEVHDNQSE